MKKLYFLILLLSNTIFGQILIDENFKDWESNQNSANDPKGDVSGGKIDFSMMKIDNDSTYIFFTFDTGTEINLQENNDIILFVDIDNNLNSGYSINGIGADFFYKFGSRVGYYYRNGSTYSVQHDDIGLMSLPTVTSDTFELAFKRKFYAGNYLVVLGNTIRALIVDNSTGGDIIPQISGGLEYKMLNKSPFKPTDMISRQNTDYLRIMSYNVEFDGFFENEPPYKRLIKAIQPDILCFQEIYDHTSSEMKNKIIGYFGGNWYDSKIGDDLIIISKYKILSSTDVGGNSAFLIDLGQGNNLLIVNAHLYCCDNDSGRQKEVDQIMSFIKSAKNKTGTLKIEKNTPIIIVGDMNFVGYNRQRKTLIEGDILNETSFGTDFLPDWDNTFFEDASPQNISYPACFTWNSIFSSYPKGRLDYIIYSGSVLNLESSFVLSTNELDRDILDKYQMNSDDSDNAADHIPVVADFTLKEPVLTTDIGIKEVDLAIFPNPGNDIFKIAIDSESSEPVYLKIYDSQGICVYNINALLIPGENEIEFDFSNYPNGFYFVQILDKTGQYRNYSNCTFMKI